MSGSSIQQQVVSAAEDLAQSVTVPLLGFLWSWIKRIIPLFVVLVVVMSLGLSAYTFYRQQRDRQLKLSVSSGRGSSAEQADLIEKKLREEQGFWGPNYLVTELATGGSLDNLRNVARDQEGNTIGIVIDGLCIDKSDKRDLNTFVPLQWCYLHFVVRIESLTNIGFSEEEIRKWNATHPLSLSTWADKYTQAKTNQDITQSSKKWPVRIYLGQANSGTHQIAELVLKNAGIRPTELEPSYYIADIEEIPEQLSRGHIDGAFVLEPLQSTVIKAIAADLKSPCTLISINNTGDLLPHNDFLVMSKIPPYTYSFTQPLTDDSHLGAIDSLATRRLIVASSKMSDSDAYNLATCIQAALPRDETSRPDKNGRWHGPSDDGQNHPPSYELHPGVALDVEHEPGINWFDRHVSWIGPLILAMAISLITELKNRIPAWLNDHQPPTPPKDNEAVVDQKPMPGAPVAVEAKESSASPNKQPTEYAAIESQLDSLYDELMVAYDRNEKPSKAKMTAWKERLDFWMRHVRPLRREGKLSRNDVEALHGTASKLRQMLNVLREPAVAVAAASFGATVNSSGDGGKSRKTPK